MGTLKEESELNEISSITERRDGPSPEADGDCVGVSFELILNIPFFNLCV